MVLSVESKKVAFVLPAMSVTLPFWILGTNVPFPAAVAEIVYIVLLTGVTDQVTPVAVPLLPTSLAVKDELLTGSLNVTVKFIGSEFVNEGWPEALTNELTEGATLS